MGQKRGAVEADGQARKKPTTSHHRYHLRRTAERSIREDEDLRRENIPLRLASLRLGQVDFPISAEISNSVKCIGDERYEFQIPFHKLAQFHRIEWGVKDSAKSIIVRLEFLRRGDDDYAGFCIHLPPNDRESEYHHNYCTTDAPWKDFVTCSPEPNFLIDTLSRKLHQFLRKGRSTARKVYDQIVEVAESDPTVACFICGNGIPCKVFRPLPCSEKCRKKFEDFPLTTRLSPFMRDPAVLDFLLCCLRSSTYIDGMEPRQHPYRQAQGAPNFTTKLRPTCPIVKEKLHDVLDSFPSISAGTTISKLLEPPEFRSEREALLSWLSSEFDGTLVTAPETAHISNMPGTKQFILLNGNIQRQSAFEKMKAHLGIGSGSPGFHGTPPMNLFSILREGLKSSAHLKMVFYSDEPTTSIGYVVNRSFSQQPALNCWTNSAFSNTVVLFGVEVSLSQIHFQHSEASSHDDTVMVRYVFLLPSSVAKPYMGQLHYDGPQAPRGKLVLPSMQDTYCQIRSGSLIDAIEKNAGGVSKNK